MSQPTPIIVLQAGEATSFVPKLSVSGSCRQQAAEELNAKCQLVKAETESDQNAYFCGVLRNAEWIMHGAGTGNRGGCGTADASRKSQFEDSDRFSRRGSTDVDVSPGRSGIGCRLKHRAPMAESCARACNSV